MTGAGILDGDVLVVSRALTGRHGDVVIAAINGETFVKRLSVGGDEVVLRSENPKYPPRYILEGDDLMIWGVATDIRFVVIRSMPPVSACSVRTCSGYPLWY
jgi:DNA polymerase V